MSVEKAAFDPPGALAILSLVAEFLLRELAPVQADAKLRYRTLVAANLLRIAHRELGLLEEFELDADGRAVPPGLIDAAGSLRAFTEDLSAGRRRLTDPETFALAMQYVKGKLRIADPEALSVRPSASSG
jgi:Domain of unknown function (DUF6285)